MTARTIDLDDARNNMRMTYYWPRFGERYLLSRERNRQQEA